MQGYIRLLCSIFGENYEGSFKEAIDSKNQDELYIRLGNLIYVLNKDDRNIISKEFALGCKEEKQDQDKVRELINSLKKESRSLYNYLFK